MYTRTHLFRATILCALLFGAWEGSIKGLSCFSQHGAISVSVAGELESHVIKNRMAIISQRCFENEPHAAAKPSTCIASV